MNPSDGDTMSFFASRPQSSAATQNGGFPRGSSNQRGYSTSREPPNRPASAGSGRLFSDPFGDRKSSFGDTTMPSFGETRIPSFGDTRAKLADRPGFGGRFRSFSPSARKSGDDILRDLKGSLPRSKRDSEDMFFQSPHDWGFSPKSAFHNK
ncbi:unnamed protein product, partial [Meganyctiphanes norvegica]